MPSSGTSRFRETFRKIRAVFGVVNRALCADADRRLLRMRLRLTKLSYQKEGKVLIGALGAVLVGFFVIYFVSHTSADLHKPLETVRAVEYFCGVGCTARGYVIRDEQPLVSTAALVTPTVQEGEKVGGERLVVANAYTDAAARRQSEYLRALEEEKQRLEDTLGALDVSYDKTALDAEIRFRLLRMAPALHAHDLDAVRAELPAFSGLILRRNAEEGDFASLRERLDRLETELDAAERSSAASYEISAPFGGYYSAEADGLETVLTPTSVARMSPSALEAVKPASVESGTFGRLIRGETWYFAAAVETSLTETLSVGDTATLIFTDDHSEEYSARVYAVGQPEGGRSVLVLSCDNYMPRVTALRRAEAEMQFDTIHGLRVPKHAVHIREDGTVGVYVLESTEMRWKNISILHDNGENYVARLDRSDTANLWPGDEIILSEEALYDGKVVAQ